MAGKKQKEVIIDKNWQKHTYKIRKDGKKATWRPSGMTPEVVKKLVEEFRSDATIEDACSYAWISTRTFYNWIKADEDFFHEIDRAMKYPFRKARNVLTALMESDKEDMRFKASQEFLSKRDSRYKSKSEDTIKTSLDEMMGSNDEGVRNKSMIDLEAMRKELLGF